MKISIITATFNSAATVRDTLDSILRQTHQDWELIIEDGLSKDDTLAIVREYEPRCKGKMRIFSEKDEGLYDAMNRGIARATGDVVGILNSDDFYHDERVLEDITAFGEQTLGLTLLGTAESPIRGREKGNIEYLAHWRKSCTPNRNVVN